MSKEKKYTKLYDYVYVNEDGSVNEIGIIDKIYLGTKFHGADSARPYIKTNYLQKDGWGEISGFCLRSKIPKNIIIKKIKEVVTKEEIINEIKKYKEMGYEVDLKGLNL
jgi:hypothetical protein